MISFIIAIFRHNMYITMYIIFLHIMDVQYIVSYSYSATPFAIMREN